MRSTLRHSPRWSFGHALAALCLTSISGCADRSASGERGSARDSADVRVVESNVPAWRAAQAWRVAAVPTLEIGVESGQEAYELYRVNDAVRLQDGRIVISNTGTQQLRSYSAEGTHLASAGGKGEGPGEFAELSAMPICIAPGDTLIVDDGGNGRQNVFAGITFVRTFRIEPLPGTGRAFHNGCFGDGSLLTRGAVGGGSLRGDPGTIIRTTWQSHRHSRDGAPLVALRQFVDRPRYVNQVGDITHYPFVPLHAEPVLAAAGGFAYFGSGDTSIEVVDTAGTLRRVIRWQSQHRIRTADVYPRYQEHTLAEMNDEQRSRYAHLYRQTLPIPEYLPAYQAMKLDAAMNLWLERYRMPWDSAAVWEVFDSAGVWLGAVETPRRLRVLRIGDDYILGRHLDELNVERVRMYRLLKP